MPDFQQINLAECRNEDFLEPGRARYVGREKGAFFALLDQKAYRFGIFALVVETLVVERCVIEGEREIAELERRARYI